MVWKVQARFVTAPSKGLRFFASPKRPPGFCADRALYSKGADESLCRMVYADRRLPTYAVHHPQGVPKLKINGHTLLIGLCTFMQ